MTDEPVKIQIFIFQGDKTARSVYLRGSSDSELIDKVCKTIPTASVQEIQVMTRKIIKSCTGVAFLRRCFHQMMKEDIINDANIGTMGRLIAVSSLYCEIQK